MRFRQVLGGLLLLVALICEAPASQNLSRECLPAFYTQRSRFDICKQRWCVVLPADYRMVKFGRTLPPEQLPFNCRYRRRLFPELDGVYFQMIDAVLPYRDVHCIWIRQGCDAEEIVKFLSDAKAGGRYLLIMGGLIFIVPEIVTLNSTPSVPFLTDYLVVLGPQKRIPRGPSFAIHALRSTLEWKTWYIVLLFLLILVLARVWVSYKYCPKSVSWKACYWCIWGEYNDVEAVALSEPDKASVERLKFYNKMWTYTLKACLAVIALFFAAGATNFIFRPNQERLPSELSRMPPELLRNFVVKKGLFADTLKEMAQQSGRPIGAGSLTPWTVVNTDQEVFEHVRQGAFTITSNLAWLAHQRAYDLCSNVTVYNARQLPRIDRGLLFGPSINGRAQIDINKRILALRDTGELERLLIANVGRDSCKHEPGSVVPFVMLFSLVFVLTPLVGVLLIVGLSSWIRRMAPRLGVAIWALTVQAAAPTRGEEGATQVQNNGST